MEKRELGRSGIHIAPLMLGGNVFGWTADEATSHAVLDAFVGGGFNAIDTADVYSAWVPGHTGGESETVIGTWLKGRGKRDDVVIATKVAMWPKHPGLRADNIVAACEDSLKRLQTDYIDLYQSHRDDAEAPQDETAEAYGRLVKAGKVRAIGASNFDAARLKSALEISKAKGLPRYETLQPAYNLMDRGIEGPLQQLCVDEGVGIISYYGLASGYLSGKYRSEADLGKSPRGAGMKKHMAGKGPQVLAAMDAIAAETGASLSQISLAWVMARPAVTAPIASATSVKQLEELMGAARLSLSPAAIAKLDAASA
ncbi:aryl-alcohol dehydrogenase-like predicted oxidoreductase [Caulobacter ginsengisoli]|uniref:Aryl-alcohol dehydrogenase-like predicted oxidoreductase n=1 Tax=Caulobacter ginsengisoli TaxID=400775 RepID=A0ABU0IL10_9CAUL|nr:aldo/keto reductase [Caulobacter ginsengisoli]MDQ0462693.1 aryl-alcohol dehydrogenase-like predicted oxidoreductase [Caulobacter ginsengisoli]